MRLAALEFQGEPRVGVVDGETIGLLSAETEMLGLLARGGSAPHRQLGGAAGGAFAHAAASEHRAGLRHL